MSKRRTRNASTAFILVVGAIGRFAKIRLKKVEAHFQLHSRLVALHQFCGRVLIAGPNSANEVFEGICFCHGTSAMIGRRHHHSPAAGAIHQNRRFPATADR